MMRRIGAVVVGMLLVMVSAFLAVGGIVLLAVIGPDGVVASPATRVVAPGSAIVVDAGRFDGGLPHVMSFSEATVTINGLADKPSFVGAGRSNDVLGYLAGTSYDVLTGADGRSAPIDHETVSGSGIPSRPAAQSFWSTQATGSGESAITVALGASDQLVVAMNEDASAPVDVRWTVSIFAPWAFPVAVAAISGGLALGAVGAWCLARATRRTRTRDGAEAVASTEATPASVAQGPTTTVVPALTEPNEWGTPIAASDEVAADVPTQRPPIQPTQPAPPDDPQDHIDSGMVRTPDEVDLRLLGSALTTASAGPRSTGPDAPPREPGR